MLLAKQWQLDQDQTLSLPEDPVMTDASAAAAAAAAPVAAEAVAAAAADAGQQHHSHNAVLLKAETDADQLAARLTVPDHVHGNHSLADCDWSQQGWEGLAAAGRLGSSCRGQLLPCVACDGSDLRLWTACI